MGAPRVERARRALAWRERIPGAPMLLIDKGGPRSRLLPHELQGLTRRPVLLLVPPGEGILCDVPAPLAGPYRWSATVGTFKKRLQGALEVEYADEQGPYHVEVLDMGSMDDNANIGLRCVVRSAGRMRIQLTNRASGDVVLQALGCLGSTTFAASGHAVPLTFAV
jgi:hypothetical protein